MLVGFRGAGLRLCVCAGRLVSVCVRFATCRLRACVLSYVLRFIVHVCPFRDVSLERVCPVLG